MNFNYLNDMINYIEEHITEEINYNKLARIVGVSEYSLQRIFMFLSDISISEYIRKRRLSRAFEELKTTDIKIVDLAVKYQYDSAISFSRAFKSLFGITPSQCRESSKKYKLFPIIKFTNEIDVCKELNYEIKDIDKIVVYCKKTTAKTEEDLLYNIRKLYTEIEECGFYKKFNEVGQYGIYLNEGNNYIYLVGSKVKYEGTEKFAIPKGKYAIFNVGSREQKDILKTEKDIYSQWLPSTKYEIIENIEFELYDGDNCYIYIPLKGKQN